MNSTRGPRKNRHKRRPALSTKPANSRASGRANSSWRARSGPCIGLKGRSANLLLEIAGQPVGLLHIENGGGSILAQGEAPATASFDTEATLKQVLGGALQPIVARLQRRLDVAGDAAMVLKILMGLQAQSPWTDLVRKARRTS